MPEHEVMRHDCGSEYKGPAVECQQYFARRQMAIAATQRGRTGSALRALPWTANLDLIQTERVDDAAGARPEFAVGFVLPGVGSCTGTLVIAPGDLTITPSQATKWLFKAQPVHHQGTEVNLYVARLRPPWMSVHLQVHGTEDWAIASLPLWSRRRLRDALEAAGFTVIEHVTWSMQSMWTPEIWARP